MESTVPKPATSPRPPPALEGRQTLVTGAASPVGRAIVEAFVERGASVIAVDRTDEAVEAAIRELGLADADEVITRGLDDSSLGDWWDLANLVAAFYHTLDVFVHIPQGPVSESWPLAIDRLKSALGHAAMANPGRVAIVVVAADADDPTRDADRSIAAAGLDLHISACAPQEAEPTATVVLERVAAAGSPR